MAGIVCLINVISVSYIFLHTSLRKLGHKLHKTVVFFCCRSSVYELYKGFSPWQTAKNY